MSKERYCYTNTNFTNVSSVCSILLGLLGRNAKMYLVVFIFISKFRKTLIHNQNILLSPACNVQYFFQWESCFFCLVSDDFIFCFWNLLLLFYYYFYKSFYSIWSQCHWKKKKKLFHFLIGWSVLYISFLGKKTYRKH